MDRLGAYIGGRSNFCLIYLHIGTTDGMPSRQHLPRLAPCRVENKTNLTFVCVLFALPMGYVPLRQVAYLHPFVGKKKKPDCREDTMALSVRPYGRVNTL